jgi:hypothetical protein
MEPEIEDACRELEPSNMYSRGIVTEIAGIKADDFNASEGSSPESVKAGNQDTIGV